MEAQIKLMAREQWDFGQDVEIHLVKVTNSNDIFYTIYLYQTTTKTYKYSDLQYLSLKEARKEFDSVMDDAPINKELQSII